MNENNLRGNFDKCFPKKNRQFVCFLMFFLLCLLFLLSFHEKISVPKINFKTPNTEILGTTPPVIVNKMVAKPTKNSITILVKTDMKTNITVKYGLTTNYGNTVTSSNKIIHEVTISNLSPSTTYHYRIVAIDTTNPSNTTTTSDYTFKTQLEAGNSFTFALIGDLQGCPIADTNDPSKDALELAKNLNPDLIISLGDNIDGRSVNSIPAFQTLWKAHFFNYTQKISNHIPIFIVLGNHDASSYATNISDSVSHYNIGIAAYEMEVAMPTSSTGGEKYYSFDYGDAHFVILNGSTPNLNYGNGGVIDNTQLAWLENDLQSSDQKYKFVFSHYLVHGSDAETWRLQNYQAVHDILKDNGVLAYFSGHRHVYNRYVKDGVFYITNFTSGMGHCILGPEYGENNYINYGGDPGTRTRAIGDIAGVITVTVSPSTVRVMAYQNDGTIINGVNLVPTEFELTSPQNNTNITGSTSTFSWNASSDNASGIAKYQLYIDDKLIKDNISPSVTSINIPITLSTGSHKWYVKAVNRAGWSTQSKSVYTINISDTEIPIISTTSVTPSSKGAIITWKTNEPASSRIDYGLTGLHESTTQEYDVTQRTTNHSVSLSNLVPCTTYTYRVRSKDSASNEAVSSWGFFNTLGCEGSSSIISQTVSTISASTGGSLSLLSDKKGISLVIPASFSTTNMNFQIKQLNKETTLKTTSVPTGYAIVGSYVYDLKALKNETTVVSSFAKPLTVSINYGISDIPNINEKSLLIYRWNGSKWSTLQNCVVSTVNKTITCTTTDFSVFGLFGKLSVNTNTPNPNDTVNTNTSNPDDDSNTWTSSQENQDTEENTGKKDSENQATDEENFVEGKISDITVPGNKNSVWILIGFIYILVLILITIFIIKNKNIKIFESIKKIFKNNNKNGEDKTGSN